MAPTAGALMRSRYAAFALKDAGYLAATWHPSTRPVRLDLASDEEWLLLRILDTRTAGEEAWVEFQARSRVAGRQQVLHERSHFVRENGRWYYVDGVIR